MTVNVSKPVVNVREKLAELDKPTGIAGEAMLRAETPQEQFNLIGAGRRNLIINGAMQVAQRGTSFTTQGYALDRFYQLLSGGTATSTQETFALGSEVAGCSKFLKQVTSSGNDYCGIIYKVEDVKSLPQGEATLSFYAKGTNPAAGSFQVVVYRMHDGVTTHDILLDTTITLTSSWQRFTNSFDVGSLAGMTTPTANSLIYIAIRQSQSDSGTAAWELNLTGVQLEAGKVATPFEHRSYGEELALCKRYFYQHNITSNRPVMGALSYVENGTQTRGPIQFPVEMRSSPTLTVGSGTYNFVNGAVSIAVSLSLQSSSPQVALIYGTGTGLTTGQVGYIRPTTDVSLSFDAEL